MGIGAPELLIILLLVIAIPVLVLYWIVRLAVRHGDKDGRRA